MIEKLIKEMAQIGWQLTQSRTIMKDLVSLRFMKDEKRETVIVDSDSGIMFIENEMLSGATEKVQINLRGQIVNFNRSIEGRYTNLDELLLYFIAKSPDGAII